VSIIYKQLAYLRTDSKKYVSVSKSNESFDSLLTFLIQSDSISNETQSEIINLIPRNRLGVKTKRNDTFYHLAGQRGDYKLVRTLNKLGLVDSYNIDNVKGFDLAISNKYFSVAMEMSQSKFKEISKLIEK
jgi:hypothetical protein